MNCPSRRVILMAPAAALLGACTTTRWYRAQRTSSNELRVPLIELEPDGWVMVEAESATLLVVRNNGSHCALSLVCTHQGCAVSKRRDELVCPCHGSRFALDGAVLEGPADKPLARYVVETRGSDLFIRADRV